MSQTRDVQLNDKLPVKKFGFDLQDYPEIEKSQVQFLRALPDGRIVFGYYKIYLAKIARDKLIILKSITPGNFCLRLDAINEKVIYITQNIPEHIGNSGFHIWNLNHHHTDDKPEQIDLAINNVYEPIFDCPEFILIKDSITGSPYLITNDKFNSIIAINLTNLQKTYIPKTTSYSFVPHLKKMPDNSFTAYEYNKIWKVIDGKIKCICDDVNVFKIIHKFSFPFAHWLTPYTYLMIKHNLIEVEKVYKHIEGNLNLYQTGEATVIHQTGFKANNGRSLQIIPNSLYFIFTTGSEEMLQLWKLDKNEKLLLLNWIAIKETHPTFDFGILPNGDIAEIADVTACYYDRNHKYQFNYYRFPELEDYRNDFQKQHEQIDESLQMLPPELKDIVLEYTGQDEQHKFYKNQMLFFTKKNEGSEVKEDRGQVTTFNNAPK